MSGLAAIRCRVVALRGAHILHVAFALSAVAPLLALEVRTPAPSFRLPRLVGESVVGSDSLFAASPFTLLVIWNTECPDCVADVVAAGRRSRELDAFGVQLVGVSTDGERIGDARRLVRGARLDFLNLWDPDGAIASAYGASGTSFSAFLVDSGAVVRFTQHDHPDDVGEMLTEVRHIAVPIEEARP